MALKDFVRTEYTEAEKQANRDQEMRDALMEETGLEGASVQKLRDTMLPSEEAVIAKTEQMDDIRARKSRKPDWDEFVDAKRRWGKAMHHTEILARLRRLIPNLYVDEGTIRNTLSLYIWDRNQPFEGKVGGTVFLAWIHLGWNPEYEVDIVDDIGVAKSQKRGWRTVLIRMITRRRAHTFLPASLFTEEQAWAEFGYPTNGNTASKYREHLFKFRNTSPERARMDWEVMQKAQQHRYA